MPDEDGPTVIELTEEAELNKGQNGYTRRRVWRVEGITVADDTNTGNYLLGALLPDEIPDEGDVLITSYADLYCNNVNAKHIGKAKAIAKVVADYVEIGIPLSSATNKVWLRGLTINGSNANILTSIDPVTNKIMYVGYKVGATTLDPSTITADDIKSGAAYKEYVRVPCLQQLASFSFKCREINDKSTATDPADKKSLLGKQKYYSGATNLVAIWGYAPGQLRLRVNISDLDVFRSMRVNTGTGDSAISNYLYDTEYLFEGKATPTGWRELATIKSPWNGFSPSDIQDPGPVLNTPDNTTFAGNGWGLFNTAKQVDFTELNFPDPRTITTTDDVEATE